MWMPVFDMMRNLMNNSLWWRRVSLPTTLATVPTLWTITIVTIIFNGQVHEQLWTSYKDHDGRHTPSLVFRHACRRPVLGVWMGGRGVGYTNHTHTCPPLTPPPPTHTHTHTRAPTHAQTHNMSRNMVNNNWWSRQEPSCSHPSEVFLPALKPQSRHHSKHRPQKP